MSSGTSARTVRFADAPASPNSAVLFFRVNDDQHAYDFYNVTGSQSTVRRPTSKDAGTAREWVQANASKLRRFAGKWVAIHSTGVIASAEGFDEVYRISKQRGVDNPLVFKVPSRNMVPRVVSSRKR